MHACVRVYVNNQVVFVKGDIKQDWIGLRMKQTSRQYLHALAHIDSIGLRE